MFQETSLEDIDIEDVKNLKSEIRKAVKNGDFGDINPEEALGLIKEKDEKSAEEENNKEEELTPE